MGENWGLNGMHLEDDHKEHGEARHILTRDTTLVAVK